MIGSCAFMNQFATHKCVFHWKRQFLEWVICLLQEHLHDTLTSAFAFLMYSIRRKRQLQPDVLWCNFNYYAVHILNLREKNPCWSKRVWRFVSHIDHSQLVRNLWLNVISVENFVSEFIREHVFHRQWMMAKSVFVSGVCVNVSVGALQKQPWQASYGRKVCLNEN